MTIICDHCRIMVPERYACWVAPMFVVCPRCLTTADDYEDSPNVYNDPDTRGHGSQCGHELGQNVRSQR